MQEATKLLKALQKLKALKLGRSSDLAESASCQGEVALLDGGATGSDGGGEAGALDPDHRRIGAWINHLVSEGGHPQFALFGPNRAHNPSSHAHRTRVQGELEQLWMHYPLGEGPSIGLLVAKWVPVMERGSALHLLSVLEAEKDPKGLVEDVSWWKELFPLAPDGVLKHMRILENEAGCPWNRRVRKRLECSKGIILLLYAGTGAKKWRSLNWRGFEVLTVEILEQSQQDVNLAATWTYLWRLASLGPLRAVVGGPPCRSVSRLRHTSPGPRPLRGRDALRYGLPGLSDSEQTLADGDTALV